MPKKKILKRELKGRRRTESVQCGNKRRSEFEEEGYGVGWGLREITGFGK